MIRSDGSTMHEQLITDGRKDTYEQKDLPIWSPTLTRVFRNRDFQDKLPNAPGLDTVMLLYQSSFGKIKFINEVTGTYRLHVGGIYSAQSEAKRKEAVFITFIESLKLVDASLLLKYFGMLFKKIIELSTLDKGLFVSNSSILKKQYSFYQKALSINDRIKINISFILLKSLSIIHSKFYKRYMLKIINRLLIYKL